MFLNRLSFRKPFDRLTYLTGIRMASSVVGKSGRVYLKDKVLQRQREEKLSILKAEYVLDSI